MVAVTLKVRNSFGKKATSGTVLIAVKRRYCRVPLCECRVMEWHRDVSEDILLRHGNIENHVWGKNVGWAPGANAL
jgi:hypothetical protein